MTRAFTKDSIVMQLYELNENNLVHADVTLRKALLFISNNYTENISTRDVAKACNVSADYISHMIKQKTGCKCGFLIRDLKLTHAFELIQNENVSITDIAYSIGFCDLSHFSRTYKKKYGVAPNNQRKNERLNRNAQGLNYFKS